MAGIESFSASMVELEKEMAELDRQLSEENEKASDLELAVSTSARKTELISTDIHAAISDICELEMEAEDLASLASQEESARAMPCPGQEVPCVIQIPASAERSISGALHGDERDRLHHQATCGVLIMTWGLVGRLSELHLYRTYIPHIRITCRDPPITPEKLCTQLATSSWQPAPASGAGTAACNRK